MNATTRHASVLALAVLGLAAVQACRFAFAVRRAIRLSEACAFDPVQCPANATRRVLVVGDSTAVGIGADSHSETIVGRLREHFPCIAIENHARLGARARDMTQQIGLAEAGSYDLVLMAVGGNDILRGTRRVPFRAALEAAVERARSIGALVIVINSANVGAAPLFPWPLNVLLSHRSLSYRSTFEEVCARPGVEFVNFTFEPEVDPFRRERSVYFAPDGLHPTAAGYAYCVDRLKSATRLAAALGLAGSAAAGDS